MVPSEKDEKMGHLIALNRHFLAKRLCQDMIQRLTVSRSTGSIY